jgi:ribose transport system ATP-binding protein
MPSPRIKMSDIRKRFPGVVALDDVHLELAKGEILALAGENGAGKSTLMNILGGIHQPDAGSIQFDGEDVVIRSVSESIEKGIGFIHQELNILENLDVAENVFLGREPVWAGPLKLVDRKRIHDEAQRCLERLGADISSYTPAGDLSIAQQQMVEIAKALLRNVTVLIMDEPTSCLTLAETARLFGVVRDLKAQGVSIIYITHRLAEISELADRVVVLRDGRNAGALEKNAINHDSIVKLMVGRELRHFRTSESGRSMDYFRVSYLRTRRYPNHATSFSVGRGEILGLAGLVGAGRSEVAHAIFGVESAIDGTITLDDEQIRINSPKDAIEHGIGLVSEDRRTTGLILEMSVAENITLPGYRTRSAASLIDRDAERSLAREMCADLNIKTPSIDAKIENLSGGNQQKAVLAKWLSLKPKVLIFDEPTRGIDVGAKSEIYRLMRRLAADGVAIIMISSDMEEILGESDRVAVMHEGAIAGTLERGQLSEEAIMRLAVGQN